MDNIKIASEMLGLLILSFCDIQKKKISIVFLALFAIIQGMLFLITNIVAGAGIVGEIEFLLKGMIPGIVMLLFSKCTGEVLGYADGIVAVIIGAHLGIERISVLLLLAFILSAMVSVALLIAKKANKHSTIPFLPFLTISYFITQIF